jgi:hypothetical protein
MKTSEFKKWSTGVLLTAALAVTGVGQVAVSETSTTTSSGTISEFSPDTVVLRSETSSEPVRYTYSKTTTVVDEAGAPVDISVVKTGVPVQVIYASEGDRMVARKIIVRKQRSATTGGAAMEEHRSTTTTTTTEGK